MSALEVGISLVLLAGLVYWLRGYGPPIRRAYRRLRQLWGLARGARVAVSSARRAAGRVTGRAAARQRTVDAAGRAVPRTVCPLCGDSLNAAQVDALRARSVRCPGSTRLGQPCPFRTGAARPGDGRTLN